MEVSLLRFGISIGGVERYGIVWARFTSKTWHMIDEGCIASLRPYLLPLLPTLLLSNL